MEGRQWLGAAAAAVALPADGLPPRQRLASPPLGRLSFSSPPTCLAAPEARPQPIKSTSSTLPLQPLSATASNGHSPPAQLQPSETQSDLRLWTDAVARLASRLAPRCTSCTEARRLRALEQKWVRSSCGNPTHASTRHLEMNSKIFKYVDLSPALA